MREPTGPRVPPAAARGAAVGGALLGALLGWLLTGWVSRRTAGRPRRSLLAGGLTAAALALLLPAGMHAAGVLLAAPRPPSADRPGAPAVT